MRSGVPRPTFPQPLALGEGARWCQRTDTVHLVDIDAGRLLLTDTGLSRLDEILVVSTTLGGAAPIENRPGTWLLAAGRSILLADSTGITVLTELDADNGTPTRLNDATVDPAGRFWVTTMPEAGADPVGGLHVLTPDARLITKADGLGIVNGPAFSPDGTTMYLADTSARRIFRFDVDPATASLSRRHTFAQFTPDGPGPDGMTVDGDLHLWVAMWGGSCLHRFAPNGTLERTVDIPASQPTSVCLIPQAAGSRVLITTATAGLAAPTEADGLLYELPATVSAVPMAAARWP